MLNSKTVYSTPNISIGLPNIYSSDKNQKAKSLTKIVSEKNSFLSSTNPNIMNSDNKNIEKNKSEKPNGLVSNENSEKNENKITDKQNIPNDSENDGLEKNNSIISDTVEASQKAIKEVQDIATVSEAQDSKDKKNEDQEILENASVNIDKKASNDKNLASSHRSSSGKYYNRGRNSYDGNQDGSNSRDDDNDEEHEKNKNFRSFYERDNYDRKNIDKEEEDYNSRGIHRRSAQSTEDMHRNSKNYHNYQDSCDVCDANYYNTNREYYNKYDRPINNDERIQYNHQYEKYNLANRTDGDIYHNEDNHDYDRCADRHTHHITGKDADTEYNRYRFDQQSTGLRRDDGNQRSRYSDHNQYNRSSADNRGTYRSHHRDFDPRQHPRNEDGTFRRLDRYDYYNDNNERNYNSSYENDNDYDHSRNYNRSLSKLI